MANLRREGEESAKEFWGQLTEAQGRVCHQLREGGHRHPRGSPTPWGVQDAVRSLQTAVFSCGTFFLWLHPQVPGEATGQGPGLVGITFGQGSQTVSWSGLISCKGKMVMQVSRLQGQRGAGRMGMGGQDQTGAPGRGSAGTA